MSSFVAGAATTAALAAIVAVAAGAGMPSGAGLVVLGVDAAVIVTSVADPFTFHSAAAEWQTAAEAVRTQITSLEAPLAEFSRYWTGDAADEFKNYWTNYLSPTLPDLVSLFDAMKGSMEAVRNAEISLIGGLLVSTGGAAGGLIAAAAAAAPTAGASLLAQWPIVSVWSALVAAGVGAMINFLVQVSSQTGAVGNAMATLKGRLYENANDLEGRKIAPPPEILEPLPAGTDIVAEYERKAGE